MGRLIMAFRQICNLFGGQTATAKVLGLKSARQVRRVCAGTNPVPKSWFGVLQKEAKIRAGELLVFSQGKGYR